MQLLWTCRCGCRTYNHYDTCDACAAPKPPPPPEEAKNSSIITGKRLPTNASAPKTPPKEDDNGS